MQAAIGVRFKRAGRIEYYKPSFPNVQRGDWVIAETTRGLECGEVVLGPGEIASDALMLRSIRRRATANDLQRHADNKRREKEAFVICKQKIEEHGLPMKLISVEFTFDVNKIIFSFTSEGRVDFRDLVRDLAYVFRTRIELRQVGVRDETKLMDGIGNCGRPLCCANFLGDFVAVSIRMAKEQNLSLNPSKISGCCGRLMCCLQYEDANYHGNCCLMSSETTISNLNAEDDREGVEKLEELEEVEEKLDNVAPMVEDKSIKAVEHSERSERNRGGEHRRSGGNRGGEHKRASGNRPPNASKVGGARPSAPKVNASEGAAGDQNKKPPQKNRPRQKKSAYQRDKNFHSRRPNIDDV
ncbi:MAG: stage 0 sporulation family protein [Selenomonadaceae bacterium]|nr:stage 0 sporulation family protein [Selenomonadaceae bacterium]